MVRTIARAGGGTFLLAALVLSDAAHAKEASDDDARVYDVIYRLEPYPAAQVVEVEMTVRQPRHFLREMSFESGRVDDLHGDGELILEDASVTWLVPEKGGRLKWTASPIHRRYKEGYDAWLDAEWGLFRAEDVIPRAATRTLKGAVSGTRMRFDLPDGWSAVSQYRETREGHPVSTPGRRFSQPAGWLVLGDLGVRRERIADVSVVVAGPRDQGVRRLDMLALLNWTLPELVSILPEPPRRLTVVSAGEPMWRGALSAPRSLYIHADRPMLSENGTSTLLHEVMHVALGLDAAPEFDWIVEGLAEYYSLELLRRSGTITPSRHRRARDDLREWSESAKTLCRRRSSGASNALAVIVLIATDAEIRKATENRASLDDVLQGLLKAGEPVDLDRLRAVTRGIAGGDLDALDSDHLPGCD